MTTTVNEAQSKRGKLIRGGLAVWVGANGVIALVLSLAHLRLRGVLGAFYVVDATAWLAQHSVVIGLLMLYLSRHIYRGEKRAWQLVMVLMGMEALEYLLLRPHIVLCLFYSFSLLVTAVCGRYFYRRTSIEPLKRRLRDLAIVVGGLLLAFTIGAIVLSHSPRAWSEGVNGFRHFASLVVEANPVRGRTLRSELVAQTLGVVGVMLIFLSIWTLFRPSRFTLTRNDQERERVKEWLEKYGISSEDYFKLWPADKSYFWDSTNQSFIAYKVAGGIAFSLADPIGPKRLYRSCLNEFTSFCRQRGWHACFLQATEASEQIFKKAGYSLLKSGGTAVVQTSQFVETTRRDKWWRWQHNRATREGYRFEEHLPPHTDDLMSAVQGVSDAWLTQPGHEERGFVMGYFDRNYLQNCTLYCAYKNDEMVAFANQPPSFRNRTRQTVDLMRFLPGVNGALPMLLDFIIADVAGKGIKEFDLGFVPLAKTNSRLLMTLRRLTQNQFGSAGLEQFKNKFDPTWEPMFIAIDGDLADLANVAVRIEAALRPQ